MDAAQVAGTPAQVVITPIKEEAGHFQCSAFVPVIPSANISWGQRLGGRALRDWFEAEIYGSKVVISKQKNEDNPPLETRRANLKAYAPLRHPNIVALLGVTTDGEVITEVCDFDLVPNPSAKGSTHHGFHKRKTLTLMQNLKYARDVARALAWAHQMNVIHRDIKPSHWLISGGHAKLGGWMFAEIQKEDLHTKPDDHFHGTPLYMAPELWGSEPFDGKKSDVYSYSLSLWELVNNDFAYAHYSDLSTFREAVVARKERPKLLDKTPPAINKIIMQGWTHDPERRPTMIQVVEELNKVIAALEFLEGADNI